MSERESSKSRGFLRKDGVLLATGAAAVALVAFAVSGAGSHNHNTGGVQAAAACGAHGAHSHGEACSLEGKDDDAAEKMKNHCPVINGRDKDGKCPLNELIGNKVVCPVMGNNSFTVTANTIAVAHEGRVYFLCCPPCEGRFKADPDKYTRHQEKDDGYKGHHHHR